MQLANLSSNLFIPIQERQYSSDFYGQLLKGRGKKRRKIVACSGSLIYEVNEPAFLTVVPKYL